MALPQSHLELFRGEHKRAHHQNRKARRAKHRPQRQWYLQPLTGRARDQPGQPRNGEAERVLCPTLRVSFAQVNNSRMPWGRLLDLDSKLTDIICLPPAPSPLRQNVSCFPPVQLELSQAL